MLTRDEALNLATKVDTWPKGLGYVLEPAPGTPRGWKRSAYRPFTPPPVDVFT
jgi:hypothetical protein